MRRDPQERMRLAASMSRLWRMSAGLHQSDEEEVEVDEGEVVEVEAGREEVDRTHQELAHLVLRDKAGALASMRPSLPPRQVFMRRPHLSSRLLPPPHPHPARRLLPPRHPSIRPSSSD